MRIDVPPIRRDRSSAFLAGYPGLMPSAAAASRLGSQAEPVQRGELAVVALQDRHHLERVPLPRPHHPAEQGERGAGAAVVDGIGEIPRRHAAGVAEERLDVLGPERAPAPPSRP